jgi:hypothetical protein
MAIFGGGTSYPGFLSIGVYSVVPHSWCGVSRLLVEFSRVPASLNSSETSSLKVTTAVVSISALFSQPPVPKASPWTDIQSKTSINDLLTTVPIEYSKDTV